MSPVVELTVKGTSPVQSGPRILYVNMFMSPSLASTCPTNIGSMVPLPSPDTSSTDNCDGPLITGGTSLTFVRLMRTVAVTI